MNFFSKNYYGIYKQESAKTVLYAPRSYMHINSKIYSVIFIRSQINQSLLYIVKWAKTKKIFKQKILAQYLSTALCSVSSISKIEVYTHRKKSINHPTSMRRVMGLNVLFKQYTTRNSGLWSHLPWFRVVARGEAECRWYIGSS